MKSIIRKLFNAQDATVQDTVSSEINPQRLTDEEGAIQVEFNQDPGTGGATGDGLIVIEAKVSADASDWISVKQVDMTNFATDQSTIVTGVPIFAYMRAAIRDNAGSFDVAASTTVSVWLME